MMKIYKKNIDHYIMLSSEINEMNIPFTGQIVVKEDDEVTREVILGRAKKIHERLVLVDHIFFLSEQILNLLYIIIEKLK
nr:hypothetical protein [Oenococcus oeni]